MVSPISGDLDRFVRVENKVVTQDATYGTDIVTWTLFAEMWAEIQDALPSRAESVLQGLTVAKNQSRIRMRWLDGVDSAMRIVDVDSGKVYQIIGGPAAIGRQAFMEMQCERVSN